MVVHEFRKNLREKLVTSLLDFNGKEIIKFEVFRLAPGSEHDWRPSEKGFSMSVRHLEELTKGIIAVARASKWLPPADFPLI